MGCFPVFRKNGDSPFERVVNCNLAERTKARKVSSTTQFIALCLSISLGVVRWAHPELDTKVCKHFLKEGRREAGISI